MWMHRRSCSDWDCPFDKLESLMEDSGPYDPADIDEWENNQESEPEIYNPNQLNLFNEEE